MRKMFTECLPRNKSRINWRESIGCELKFIYDNIEGQITIINYYKKNKIKYLTVKYKNNLFNIQTSSIRNCKINDILHNELFSYKYNIGDILYVNSGTLQILEQIKKDNKRAYKYHCLICKNEDIILEYDLNEKRGCNVCCNHKILKGYNDMWTTNPKLAELLANPEDGYKYTKGANKPTDFRCPNCGHIIKNKKICDINSRGLSCPKCSDRIPYTEKFMYNILEQLQLDFKTQLSRKILKWCNKYKYDFYFELNNEQYIIETHGKQHYEETTGHYDKTLQEEQENDRLKEQLAKENGIKKENYIVIDCRKSELDWIRNSVVNSRLRELFDLSKIDWSKCHEFACNSLIKSVCDLWNSGNHNISKISKILKLYEGTIRDYLKQGAKINLCNYDVKQSKINHNRINGIKSRKKIICLNTKQIFNSLKDAVYHYNHNYNDSGGHISQCCNNKRIYAGKSTTGEYLQWQYYDEYLIKPKKLLANEEIDIKILSQHVKSRNRKVICLNNKKKFDSIEQAQKFYNIIGISQCCLGNSKSAGKDPVTGEKLHWMYYDKYLEY